MNTRLLLTIFSGSLVIAATQLGAQQKPTVSPERFKAVMDAAWAKSTPEWKARLDQDEAMKICTETRNHPSAAQADLIAKAAKANIVYPADGKFVGDWKRGEALAQSGYGGRTTDKAPNRPNGGNCYACHQVSPKEVAYGTMGPSLLQYGKIRKFAEADAKAVYEKIYNSHATFPCSNMPRFGTHKFLSIEDMKDLTALLMDPQSPVNQ